MDVFSFVSQVKLLLSLFSRCPSQHSFHPDYNCFHLSSLLFSIFHSAENLNSFQGLIKPVFIIILLLWTWAFLGICNIWGLDLSIGACRGYGYRYPYLDICSNSFEAFCDLVLYRGISALLKILRNLSELLFLILNPFLNKMFEHNIWTCLLFVGFSYFTDIPVCREICRQNPDAGSDGGGKRI